MRRLVLLPTLILAALVFNAFGDEIPACMLNYRFGPEVHLLVVDKSTHTLFVYSNYSSKPLTQFRVTTGKNKGQKQFEGDSKTPEGIYFFTRIINEPELPKIEDYGEKAFVTDYPNPFDRSEKRNGSGIWLHGAHDPEKTSTPNNSRGCVVMSNEDLTKVSKYIYLNLTPLCIYERIPLVPEQEIIARRQKFLDLLSRWKQNWEEKDTDAYISHYDERFTGDGMGREAFRRHKDQLNKRYRYIRVLLNNLSVYAHDGYNLALFNQVYLSDQNLFHNHKIQYWVRQNRGERLAILDEKSRRLPAPDRIEVDEGNWVTIHQFRSITEKKLLSRKEPVPGEPAAAPPRTPSRYPVQLRCPAIEKLSLSSASDSSLLLELNFVNHSEDWRFIPVLTAVQEKQIRYISLEGISLKEGIPSAPHQGVPLKSSTHRFTLPLPLESTPRSLTVFLSDRDGRIRQIVTSMLAP